MTVTDELLRNAEHYAETFDKGQLPMPPARQVAIVTCMDARLNVYGVLGLQEGDAHVIRNAGGVVSDDVIRSLSISQRLLGTREIILVHHTDCGMLTFRDDELKAQIEEDTSIRPPFALEAFVDVDADVRQSLLRIKASPFIPRKEVVRGFVYEVEKGALREVTRRQKRAARATCLRRRSREARPLSPGGYLNAPDRRCSLRTFRPAAGNPTVGPPSAYGVC